jgi:hypothetical protein
MFLFEVVTGSSTKGQDPRPAGADYLQHTFSSIERAFAALPNICGSKGHAINESELPTLAVVERNVNHMGRCGFYGQYFDDQDRHAVIVRHQIY